MDCLDAIGKLREVRILACRVLRMLDGALHIVKHGKELLHEALVCTGALLLALLLGPLPEVLPLCLESQILVLGLLGGILGLLLAFLCRVKLLGILIALGCKLVGILLEVVCRRLLACLDGSLDHILL